MPVPTNDKRRVALTHRRKVPRCIVVLLVPFVSQLYLSFLDNSTLSTSVVDGKGLQDARFRGLRTSIQRLRGGVPSEATVQPCIDSPPDISHTCTIPIYLGAEEYTSSVSTTPGCPKRRKGLPVKATGRRLRNGPR